MSRKSQVDIDESANAEGKWLEANVLARRQIADAVVELVLEAPRDREGFEAWTPGAHIDVRLPSGTIRQYSLCGDPGDGTLTIAVLRQLDGRGGSIELHDEVGVGCRIHVSRPRNHFALRASREVVFIAGGIGITPILPMIRAIAKAGTVPWRLVYGGRSRSAMAYADELVAFGEAVRLVPEDTDGLVELTFLTALGPDTAVYVCGPQGLIDAVSIMMDESPAALYFERFAADLRDEALEGGLDRFEIQIGSEGEVVDIGSGDTVLDAVLSTSARVDYSCEEGTCGTCITRVLEGEPFHRDTILTDAERADGYMLICVSGSRSQRLVLDL